MAEPERCCRCAYVRRTPACTAEERYVPYLDILLCASPTARFPLLLVSAAWLLLLFFCLSEVAETFLVPAVEVRLPGSRLTWPALLCAPFTL